jgi:hypothetical protein
MAGQAQAQSRPGVIEDCMARENRPGTEDAGYGWTLPWMAATSYGDIRMLAGFDKIVEERIRDAQRRGMFNHLEGAGKPLKPDEFANVPEELRLAYKILKNADMLPPEIELKKEIIQTEDLLRGMGDTVEKYRTIKKLNFLILKLNSMRGGPIEFEIPQHYEQKMIDRLEAAKSGTKR